MSFAFCGIRSVRMVLAALVAGPFLPAFGGTLIGNGGDVVVCRSPQGPRTELLDLYEWKAQFGGAFSLEGTTALEKVRTAIARVGALDLTLKTQLEAKLPVFLQKRAFVEGGSLPEIDDARPRVELGSCDLRQLVVHTLPERGETSQFLIDAELWGRLSETHRAAAILHELLYAISRVDAAAMNSDGVRAFVGRVFSAPVDTVLDAEKVLGLIAQLPRDEAGYPVPSGRSLEFLPLDLRSLSSFEFHASGALAKARLLRKIGLPLRVRGIPSEMRFQLDDKVRFDETGRLVSFTNRDDGNLPLGTCLARVAGGANCPAHDGDCGIAVTREFRIESVVLASRFQCRLEGNVLLSGNRGDRLHFERGLR